MAWNFRLEQNYDARCIFQKIFKILKKDGEMDFSAKKYFRGLFSKFEVSVLFCFSRLRSARSRNNFVVLVLKNVTERDLSYPITFSLVFFSITKLKTQALGPRQASKPAPTPINDPVSVLIDKFRVFRQSRSDRIKLSCEFRILILYSLFVTSGDNNL